MCLCISFPDKTRRWWQCLYILGRVTEWIAHRTHNHMIMGLSLTGATQQYPWARCEPGHCLTIPSCKIGTGK